MPTKRPQLVNNGIYHIVLRGVDGAIIFADNSDYYRGIFSIFEFNDSAPVHIRDRRRNRLRAKRDGREQFSANRDLLVEILAFCFMPNHIHLLLKQLKDGGITSFMRKFGAGYVTYFNKRHNRNGHLFQGRFKAVHVIKREQLENVFVYIHVNPISLIEPGWKEAGTRSSKKALSYIENYKWSSFQDYIGKKNFPSIINQKFLLNEIGDRKILHSFVSSWINHKEDVKNMGNVVLE